MVEAVQDVMADFMLRKADYIEIAGGECPLPLEP